MGWLSDFVSAPAATISGTVDDVATNPIIAGQVAFVNTGVQAVTGFTPTEQYAIGAAGGTAGYYVPGLQAAVGSGLSTVGSAIAPYTSAGVAGVAGVAGTGGATSGFTAAGAQATASAAATKWAADKLNESVNGNTQAGEKQTLQAPSVSGTDTSTLIAVGLAAAGLIWNFAK